MTYHPPQASDVVMPIIYAETNTRNLTGNWHSTMRPCPRCGYRLACDGKERWVCNRCEWTERKDVCEEGGVSRGSGRRKACAKPGCPTVHGNHGAYCDEHRPAVIEDRPNSAQRGYDADWRRESAAFLKAHPWCQCESCRGSKRAARAEVVDHIIPHRGDRALFWDRGNWQALAKRCHDRKTAEHDGGFGR